MLKLKLKFGMDQIITVSCVQAHGDFGDDDAGSGFDAVKEVRALFSSFSS
jgi:hypothetical protein